MMVQNYYHLVASLPEFVLKADNTQNAGLLQIRDYILDAVSEKDAGYVCNLLSFIDNYNLIALVFGKKRTWKQGGKFIPESVSVSELQTTDLPRYMKDFLDYVEQYESENKARPDEFAAEQYLYDLYYREMMASKNLFISKWFECEREIKNVQAAYLCRKADISAENQLIVEDELTGALLKNNAQDFGLSREHDHLAKLIQILEIQDLLDREKKLDMFRWNNIDEITTFEYFTVNAALGVLQKACIIDRWAALDGNEGEKIFRNLLKELKSWKS